MKPHAQIHACLSGTAALQFGSQRVPYTRTITVEYPLSAAQLDALQRMGERTGLSAVELVRGAIEGLLAGAGGA